MTTPTLEPNTAHLKTIPATHHESLLGRLGYLNLDAVATKVLEVILRHASLKKGWRAFPSVATIAKLSHIKKRDTVHKYIKTLEQDGWLVHKKQGAGRSNLYQPTTKLFEVLRLDTKHKLPTPMKSEPEQPPEPQFEPKGMQEPEHEWDF